MTETRRPRVVMVVANAVTSDARVQKAALTAANAGWETFVVGWSPTGERYTTRIGDATVIRVPSKFPIKNYQKTKVSRWGVNIVGYGSKSDLVHAKLRRKARERETGARIAELKVEAARLDRRGAAPLATLQYRVIWQDIRGRRLALKAFRKWQGLREWAYRRQTRTGSRSGMQDRVLELQERLRRRDWRYVLPELDDFDLAFGPVIEELEPDLIHAHDIATIGIAARSAARLSRADRQVRWLYDAHEYVAGMPNHTPARLAAFMDLEREYVGRADAVVTVSPILAQKLREDHRLAALPDVVLNAPYSRGWTSDDNLADVDIRQVAGVADDVPLIVYSGGIDPHRGVDVLVRALPLLPEVHLALVCKTTAPAVQSLVAEAARLGVSDRVHLAPYVAPHLVPQYLASADVGAHTLPPCGNHDVALPNKYFEYMHAGLPMVVSDVQAMKDLTERLGVGETFAAGSETSFAAAVQKVLADRTSYADAYARRPELLAQYSWEAQGAVLLEVYARLVEPPSERPAETTTLEERAATDGGTGAVGRRTGVKAPATGLLIGPRNVAGQAWAWAEAVRRQDVGTTVRVQAIDRASAIRFPSDEAITGQQWRSRDWQLEQVRRVLEQYSHVICEAGSSLFGTLTGGDFDGDLPLLRSAGIEVAVVLHGSEARDPAMHARLEPASPFKDRSDDLTVTLQRGADRLLPKIRGFDGCVFVSTLDLLDYVPGATWLPVTVDTGTWHPGSEPLRRSRPVVVHAPSHSILKGSAAVDAVAHALHDDGLIEYRRLQDIPVDRMPEVLRDADIVLDQFALGDYGVLACQAMASERIVVGNVSERVRERLDVRIPIVQATAGTLEEVLRGLVDDAVRSRDTAAAGRAFVEQHHDGTMAGKVLRGWLAEGSA